MKARDIEAWTLKLLKAEPPLIEDSRIEFKAEVVDDYKAARRLAGHANAARGGTILWLFGVDSNGTPLGYSVEDFAPWWQKVRAWFDGPAPRPSEHQVPLDGRIITAVAFVTSDAPYVVRNRAYGRKDGGPVELEVPWREMTSVRTATRADLMTILAPIVNLPEVQILEAKLSMIGIGNPASGEVPQAARGAPCNWDFRATFYGVPQTVDGHSPPIVIPAHQIQVKVEEAANLGVRDLELYEFTSPNIIRALETDIVLEKPQRFKLFGRCSLERVEGVPAATARAEICFTPAGAVTGVVVRCLLERKGERGTPRGDTQWEYP